MTKASTAKGVGGVDGARVKERRLALGLTQADLATRSGLSQEAISRLENGRIRGLMQPTQDALAEALGVSVEWVRGGDDEAPAQPSREAPSHRADARRAEALDEAAEDPLMRAASQAFDPRRHHLLVDANRVLGLLNAVELRLLGGGELADVARAWLDGASALRREGVAVTAENLLWKVTAARR